MRPAPRCTPQEALDRLLTGHSRFLKSEFTHTQRAGVETRRALLQGQAPYAAVLGCADSRTSPEHLFDAGLGELFVCRTAGNLLDPVVIGSIEYAVLHLGCSLLMVLGHSSCGAVTAAVGLVEQPGAAESPSLAELLGRLKPAALATRSFDRDRSGWIEAAAQRNVILGCQQLLEHSPLLKAKRDEGHLGVVGGWYSLADGSLTMLEPFQAVH